MDHGWTATDPVLRLAAAIPDVTESTLAANGIAARYYETDAERVLAFERESDVDGASGGAETAAVAQNREGYAMLMVRTAPDGDELERYYGFEMALDHVAERLGVAPGDLPVPDGAEDMGM